MRKTENGAAIADYGTVLVQKGLRKRRPRAADPLQGDGNPKRMNDFSNRRDEDLMGLSWVFSDGLLAGRVPVDPALAVVVKAASDRSRRRSSR